MTSNAAQWPGIAGRENGFTVVKIRGPRTWKALAVFVVAACVAIHGQSSPKQMADPATYEIHSSQFANFSHGNLEPPAREVAGTLR